MKKGDGRKFYNNLIGLAKKLDEVEDFEITVVDFVLSNRNFSPGRSGRIEHVIDSKNLKNSTFETVAKSIYQWRVNSLSIDLNGLDSDALKRLMILANMLVRKVYLYDSSHSIKPDRFFKIFADLKILTNFHRIKLDSESTNEYRLEIMKHIFKALVERNELLSKLAREKTITPLSKQVLDKRYFSLSTPGSFFRAFFYLRLILDHHMCKPLHKDAKEAIDELINHYLETNNWQYKKEIVLQVLASNSCDNPDTKKLIFDFWLVPFVTKTFTQEEYESFIDDCEVKSKYSNNRPYYLELTGQLRLARAKEEGQGIQFGLSDNNSSDPNKEPSTFTELGNRVTFY